MAIVSVGQKSAVFSPLGQYLGNPWHRWLQTGSIRAMPRALSGLHCLDTVKNYFKKIIKYRKLELLGICILKNFKHMFYIKLNLI